MKRILFFLTLAFAVLTKVHAESNVYVFVKGMYNCDITIAVNGTEVCDLNGSVAKTMDVYGGGTMTKRESCYRKIVVNGEGKIVLTGTMLYTVPTTGNVNPYKGEISLDIEDGETYYLQLTSKGIHDMQIKEVKPKDAKKWEQKWQNLGDVNFNL